MILLITEKASLDQIAEMSRTLVTYIKLAVDIERGVLAGGGALHADCEAELLKDGSQQENIWGADWYPDSNDMTFEALINIRPGQNNLSIEIQDITIRTKIEAIVRQLLEIKYEKNE